MTCREQFDDYVNHHDDKHDIILNLNNLHSLVVYFQFPIVKFVKCLETNLLMDPQVYLE